MYGYTFKLLIPTRDGSDYVIGVRRIDDVNMQWGYVDGGYLEFSNWDSNPILESPACAVMLPSAEGLWQMSAVACNHTLTRGVCQTEKGNTFKINFILFVS